jgi:hypothetical protein
MKKQVVASAFTLGLLLRGGPAMAQEGFKVVDAIAGTSLKLIQSALPEFTRRGLNNLEGYRIVVTRDNGRHVVLFQDLNAPPGLGSRGEKPGLEVELNEDGAVVRSYFPR